MFGHRNCTYKKERRVSAEERNFLEDQRHGRTMMIGGVDVKVTQRLQQRNNRKNMELKERVKSVALQSTAEAQGTCVSSSSSGEEEMSNDEIAELDTDNSALSKKSTQMRSPLSKLAPRDGWDL